MRGSRGGGPAARRHRAARLAAVVLPLCLLLLAVACGHSGRSLPPSSPDDQRFLDLAENELIKRCMERAGFQFNTETPQLASSGRSQWGTEDVGAARRRGYGLTAGGNTGFVDPNAAYIASLSPPEATRFDHVFTGTHRISLRLPNGTTFSIGSDGCVAKARIQLYGNLQRYFQLSVATMQIETDVDKLIAADPEYTRALAGWQRCMRSKGFDASDPGQAYDIAVKRFKAETDPTVAKAKEIQVAVADAECGKRMGLVHIGNRLERTYRERLESEREGVILAALELRAKAVARAKNVLGGGVSALGQH